MKRLVMWAFLLAGVTAHTAGIADDKTEEDEAKPPPKKKAKKAKAAVEAEDEAKPDEEEPPPPQKKAKMSAYEPAPYPAEPTGEPMHEEAVPVPWIGSRSRFILGADRLFGYYSSSTEVSGGGATFKTEASNFSFLWGSAGPVGATPRLAFDFSLDMPITFGATFGYASSGGSRDVPSRTGTTTRREDLPDFAAWIVGVRAGGILKIADHASIWLRVGLSYSTNSTKSTSATGSSTELQTSASFFNLEGFFVLEPLPHVGFTFGPFADLGIGGSAKVIGTSSASTVADDAKASCFGLTAGMLLYF